MKVKCEFCKTEWESRELSHHPLSQEWVGDQLVACPYCCDEADALEMALACLAGEARRVSATGGVR